MDNSQELQRIIELRKEIRHHDKLYYEDNAPVLTDDEYNAVRKELERLEALHPDAITADSPTQVVSGKPGKGLKQVTHAKRMLSLYTETDFTSKGAYDFTRRVSEYLIKNKISTPKWWQYCCEFKFDGLAVTLRYEGGWLVQASTRGDGDVGEDVTENVKTIKSIPHYLDGNWYTGTDKLGVLEVTGEVMMSRTEFARINNERMTAGEKLYVNPRNAAAGCLRRLDSKETAKCGLIFYAYGIGEATMVPADTQAGLLGWLYNSHIPVYPYYRVTTEPHELVTHHQEALELRKSLDFDIDGVVYKLNSLELQEKLGVSGREPRWATAHKFEPEGALTKVHSIEIQVGRTGKITPVAKVDPVFVGGVTISSVTLHNESEIARKDIRIGDTVKVQRAGDVIPEIVEVVSRDLKNSVSYVFPTACPECGSPLIQQAGQVDHRCSGGTKCPAQGIQKLIHFCSRKAMAIDGFGDKLIEQLYEEGIVMQPYDFFMLGVRKKAKQDDKPWLSVFLELSPAQRTQLAYNTLSTLEGLGERSARSLLEAVQKAKATTLPKLIYSLGIRHASEGTAKRLVKSLKTLQNIQNATREELEKIDDIGPVVSASLVEYFSDEENKQNLEMLFALGVDCPSEQEGAEQKPLAGMSFVITGSSQVYPRDKLTEELEKAGAKVTNSVTKKTDYLFVGEDPGKAKVAQAITHNVPVIILRELEVKAFETKAWFVSYAEKRKLKDMN